MVSVLLDLIQLAALLTIIAGVFLTFPVGLAMVLSGALVLVATIAVERTAE